MPHITIKDHKFDVPNIDMPKLHATHGLIFIERLAEKEAIRQARTKITELLKQSSLAQTPPVALTAEEVSAINNSLTTWLPKIESVAERAAINRIKKEFAKLPADKQAEFIADLGKNE